MSVSAVHRGKPPKGSAQGLFALVALTALVPFLVLQSLVPVIKNGLHIWMGSLLPVLGASALVSALSTIGIYRRPNWYVALVYTYGCLLLAGWIVGLGCGFLILSGVVPVETPSLRFGSYVNVIEWVIFSPIAWLLLRMLRLAYWQPWTSQADWEQEEKLGPPRTLLAMFLARRK